MTGSLAANWWAASLGLYPAQPSPPGGRGWQLEPGRGATWFLLRSLHRFSAFQVAGRRCVPLAFSARRRLVALHDLLLVVQEHAAQRPPDAVAGAGFVDVVRDPSPRLPGLAGPGRLILAFRGLTSLGGRSRGGRALATRGYDRGVQEYQRVSPSLEGGVAMPGGVGLGAFVNLPAGPFVPVAAGAGGSARPARSRPATDTRGGACRPGGGRSVSSCLPFQSGAGHRRRCSGASSWALQSRSPRGGAWRVASGA